MWKIILKQALRYIINQRKYSLVVIIGLSVGLAASFLIYSYVYYERSYDSFHSNKNELYRIVVTNKQVGKDAYKSPYSYAPQGPVALAEVPEVENFVRLLTMPKVVISADESNAETMIAEGDYYYADEKFFGLFTFPLIYGSPETVLKEPGTSVISESMANKLYGTQNPVGKEMKINGQYTMQVTGVFKDIPENSHLKFKMLFSLNTFPGIMNESDAWNNHAFFTYVLLKKGANPRAVEAKLTAAYLKENRAVNQMNCSWNLQPVHEAYLNTSDFTSKPEKFKFGDERMVYFLTLISLLILCIAWANYINITTAKSAERIKEIGVRKTNGAGRIQILWQFFTESVLFNIISVLFAAVIIALFFGWFKKTMAFSFSLFNNPGFWLVICSVFIIGVMFQGCVTAISVSKLAPFKTLFSGFKPSTKSSYRNVLVVFQFIIIIALIVGVVFVNKQLKYIHSVDLGFKKEQVLVLNAPRVNFNGDKEKKINIFREILMKNTEIGDVTASTSIPGQRFGSGNGGPVIKGQQDGNTYFRVGRVMPNYLDFYGIKLIAGRSFYDNPEANERMVVINKEAVKEFGLQDPNDAVQKQVIWNGGEATIIGVTQSFHQQSLHIVPEPMIIYTMDNENSFNYLLVKVGTHDLKKSIASVEDAYKTIFPNNPCDYFFLDSFFDQQYKKDIAFRKLFSFFSIIALFIGYFGLYGLTTFRIIRRTKEIGIRKVNGARVIEILAMLNQDFTKWVAIAFVVACPIAWYAMNKWLENFAYKTDLSWWVFAVAGLLALMVALVTVSWQSWKAATSNPIKSLRYE
jgi:putative ABC transport system permease protein